MPNPTLPSVLARSFLCGKAEREQIVARAAETLGRRWLWLRPLAQRYIESIAGKTRPRHRDVVRFIRSDPGYNRALSRYSNELRIERWLAEPEQMQPISAAQNWGVPIIESVGALADWLWLDPADVEWLADLKALGLKQHGSRLRHYHYRVLAKPSGGIRLIEAPKQQLKKLQREILAGILEKIPPHPAAQGFLKGRSIQTFTAPHVGKRVVLRMDLRDFFASIGGARVQTIFRAMGYPEPVADLLGGICTNVVPRDVWSSAAFAIDPAELQEARRLYSRPHLPQGAPTSPALANICSFRVDCRLTGLAKSAGAEFTRYADDLAFSGGAPFERCVDRFSTHVAAVLAEEGCQVHHRKTRIMRQSVKQHLVGLVVNEKPNVVRADFDRLKATLTNCVRLGPESQNRGAHPAFHSHLDGRVAFVEMVNAEKGKRLRSLFEQIRWS